MSKMPDPATPEESTVIAISIKDALAAIRKARAEIVRLRPSDEYVDALGAIDSARSILAAFIDREG